MAGRKTTGRKKPLKKAAPKKAAAKKAVKKKTAKKKAGAVKKAAQKPAGRKKQSPKAVRHHKPKLGFDPLSHEDIEALTTPAGTVAPLEDEDHHTGIDALIRDTSQGRSAQPDIPKPAAPETEPGGSPEIPETEPEVVLSMGEPGYEDEVMEPAPEEEAAAPEVPQPEVPQPEVPQPEVPQPVEQAAVEQAAVEQAAVEQVPALESAEPQEVSVPELPVQRPSEKKAPVEEEEKAAPPVPSPKTRDEDERAEFSTFFSFRLGMESFAIEIETVREVLQYQEPTKVPKTPPHMLGVINLRGNVVPVVGLRVLFGMPEVERTVHTAVIIVDVNAGDEKASIGVLVDAVREVMEIKDVDIAPPPRLGTGLNTDYIRGMGRYREEFVMILETDRAFSVNELL